MSSWMVLILGSRGKPLVYQCSLYFTSFPSNPGLWGLYWIVLGIINNLITFTWRQGECVLCVQRISLQSLMLRLLFQTHGQMGSCFFKVRWVNAPMNCFDERNLRGNDIFRVHCLSAALIVTHPLSGKGALMLSSLSENDMAWTLSWSETGRSVRGKKTQLRCGSCSTILQQNLALFD